MYPSFLYLNWVEATPWVGNPLRNYWFHNTKSTYEIAAARIIIINRVWCSCEAAIVFVRSSEIYLKNFYTTFTRLEICRTVFFSWLSVFASSMELLDQIIASDFIFLFIMIYSLKKCILMQLQTFRNVILMTTSVSVQGSCSLFEMIIVNLRCYNFHDLLSSSSNNFLSTQFIEIFVSISFVIKINC